MLKSILHVLFVLISLFTVTTDITPKSKGSCIELIDVSGTYAYPSIYVTGLPADLEIIFSNEMTVYRFQGLNDTAIRAELPTGMYTVIAYYGREQVSNIYYFEVVEGRTLMLSAFIPERCYPKPVGWDKAA